jgi:glycosyltransferase involved in cell wall biosynthesis
MDQKDKNKIKVVWICNFSNNEIQRILHPGIYENEYSSWITRLAELFEKDDIFELHIISAQNHILRNKHFQLKGVNYHFFNPQIILFGKSFSKFHLDYKTNFLYLKIIIKRIVKKIKPDLIHLHGTEVDHSSSILQFKSKYPVLVTVQGFISHSTNSGDYFIKNRIINEQKIFKKFKHFGYRTKTMGQDIKKYNPDAVLHWHHYPFPDIKLHNLNKKFDLVFFARVTKDKGIEDLLNAVINIKKHRSDISLCIIGGTNYNYINYLKEKTRKSNISENIFWTGFLPDQEEVYKIAAESRISVLPTYNEIISGTIIESMFLKIPVIAYDTGSIHEINEGEEFISLVPKGDINELANEILYLLENSSVQKERSEKAYKRALEMFDNKRIYSDLRNAYYKVMDDFTGR